MQTAREAVTLLQRQRREVTELLDRLPSRALSRPGLGGGSWAPTDLIGHLESWEEHALRALAGWSRGEVAPIGRDLRALGLNAVNAREVEGKSGRTARRVRASADATFARLVEQIRRFRPNAGSHRPRGDRGARSGSRSAGYSAARAARSRTIRRTCPVSARSSPSMGADSPAGHWSKQVP